MPTLISYDPEDDEPWDDIYLVLAMGWFIPPKPVMDACPCCNGKGYVTIVKEE